MIGGEAKTGVKVRVEGEKIYGFEEFNNFEYLDATSTNDNIEEAEINARLVKESKCVGAIPIFFQLNKLYRSVIMRIYKTMIRPTVLRRCEAWI